MCSQKLNVTFKWNFHEIHILPPCKQDFNALWKPSYLVFWTDKLYVNVYEGQSDRIRMEQVFELWRSPHSCSVSEQFWNWTTVCRAKKLLYSIVLKFMRIIRQTSNQEHMFYYKWNFNKLLPLTVLMRTYNPDKSDRLTRNVSFCVPHNPDWKGRVWGSNQVLGVRFTTVDTRAQRSLTKNFFFFFWSFFFFFIRGHVNTSARPEWDQSAH